ncbi:MAG: carbohydrate-binding protein, partial [Bacteroidota bacterium]
MQTNIKYIFLILFAPILSLGQGLELEVSGQLDCAGSTYCVDIILSSPDQSSYQVGASALYFNYNSEALSFKDYVPGAFSPDLPCFTSSVPAWEIQHYDAFSHPGVFNLALQNNLENTSCPSIVNGHNLVIGTLCFDILQEGGNPEIELDVLNTSFNQFGSTSILPFLGASINSQTGDLACNCPGAGTPCDDQDIYTSNDQYDIDCNCRGEYADRDQDGILDGIDPCFNQYYEAEEALINGPVVKDNRAQYFGNGFADFNWGNNEYVEFTVEIAAEDQYELGFRYTLEGTDNDFQIHIDGQIVEEALVFAQTTSSIDWQDQTISRTLSTGQHTVRLQNNSGRGPNLDRLSISLCTDCEQAGMPCDDGDPCTIEDIIDANCNCGGRVVDEDNDQVPDVCDPNVGDATTLPFETGLIQDVTDQWITIPLEQTYQSMVVIATPLLSDRNQFPVVTRIQNASGNSFELRLQNPSGSNFGSNAVYYVVAEEGIYTLENDGIKMEVRKDSTLLTANYQKWNEVEGRAYQQNYQEPVVLGQVMTYNDPKWSVFWASQNNNSRDIPSASSLSLGKNVAEDADRERQPEVLGSIIIEAGSYTIQNKQLEARLGEKTIRGINNTGYQYSLIHPSSRGAVLSMAGMEGGNGGWPVLFGNDPVNEADLTLVIDEDQIKDNERGHTEEQVAFLAFEDLICLQDSDGDTVCDEDDVCPGADDLADADGDGIPDGCDDCNVLLTGTPCDDGDPCTVLDRYTFDCGCQGIPMDNDGDGVCNWEDICEGFDDNIDVDGDGIPDACDPNVGDASTFPIETGMVSEVSEDWMTIPLAKSFNTAVVVATPWLTSRDHAPVVTRIKNVTNSSFDLKIQNPGGSIDNSVTVYFTVVEEGV